MKVVHRVVITAFINMGAGRLQRTHRKALEYGGAGTLRVAGFDWAKKTVKDIIYILRSKK